MPIAAACCVRRIDIGFHEFGSPFEFRKVEVGAFLANRLANGALRWKIVTGLPDSLFLTTIPPIA